MHAKDSINQVEFYKSQFRFDRPLAQILPRIVKTNGFRLLSLTQLFRGDVFPNAMHLAKYKTMAAFIVMIF